MPETSSPPRPRDRLISALRALAAGASQTCATSVEMALLAPPASAPMDLYR